jgi:hypothetical protein
MLRYDPVQNEVLSAGGFAVPGALSSPRIDPATCRTGTMLAAAVRKAGYSIDRSSAMHLQLWVILNRLKGKNDISFVI